MSEVDHGPYFTRSGRMLTGADVDALAAEAEQGYDPATIRCRWCRRPPGPPHLTDAEVVERRGDPTVRVWHPYEPQPRPIDPEDR